MEKVISENQNTNMWNKVMKAALSIPGTAVNREDFLKTALRNICSDEQIETAIEQSPLLAITLSDIDHVAKVVISSHVKKVTMLSAAAGIPGGWWAAATIPADVAQYYHHIFVLVQKLAYLYGLPSLLDENGKVSDNTIHMLTIFVGVMTGTEMANRGLKEVTKRFAEHTTRTLKRKALTKTTIYPIVKKIASTLGYKITRESFTKNVGKIIPIAGALISGTITFATFKPCANRLRNQLKENSKILRHNLKDSAHTDFDEYAIEDAEFVE